VGSFESQNRESRIYLPSGMDSGIYMLTAQVVYGDYSATSQRTIEIDMERGTASLIEPGGFWTNIYMSLGLAIIFVLFGIVLYAFFDARNRRRRSLNYRLLEIGMAVEGMFRRKDERRIRLAMLDLRGTWMTLRSYSVLVCAHIHRIEFRMHFRLVRARMRLRGIRSRISRAISEERDDFSYWLYQSGIKKPPQRNTLLPFFRPKRPRLSRIFRLFRRRKPAMQSSLYHQDSSQPSAGP
jgi:hypothetical protein